MIFSLFIAALWSLAAGLAWMTVAMMPVTANFIHAAFWTVGSLLWAFNAGREYGSRRS